MTLLQLDSTLTNALYDLTRHNLESQRPVYLIATYLIFLLPILLFWFLTKPNTRLVAANIFVLTIVVWQIISKGVGGLIYRQYGFRDRPFAFSGVKELLFEQPQKAFPSDHAAVLLFVTLALFHYRQKTWAWVFLVATVLSSIARVAVGFHWVGDILGGWAIGLVGYGLLLWLDRPLQTLCAKIARLFGVKYEPTTR